MKPPYRVPSMKEIEAIPNNGFNVVSTFSGAGGSCLGYRMAGYRVLWANEFVPVARDTYKANHPNSILDGRDIRTVQAHEILDAIGFDKGQLDLFDGSPPCTAFSTAGKVSKGWGVKAGVHNQVVEDLSFEYARLLEGLQPKTFVVENVTGLVKGKSKGYFFEILQSLKDCGYNVQAKVLDASWLGVPQMRKRVIFIGVRNDLGLTPVFPKPMAYQYTLRDALRDLPEQKDVDADISKYAIAKQWKECKQNGWVTHPKRFSLSLPKWDGACNTITAHASISLASVCHPDECRRFYVSELKRIQSFPDDFVLHGKYPQKVERIGNSVPPVMMMHIASAIRDNILNKVKER